MDIKNVIKFKILIIFTLIMWLIYDIFIKSYSSALFDFLNIITNIIAIYKIKNIKIIYMDPIKSYKVKIYDNILSLLNECNNEFVPPLSSRYSTQQKEFNNIEVTNQKPNIYFDMIIKQHNIVAINNDKVVGIMSFINNYDKKEYFGADFKNKNNNYISTVCVKKEFRHKKIATRLYDFIENQLPQEIKGECVSTRTWSSNKLHINLLNKRGYENTYTIKDDRTLMDNTKVDTMYFCKAIKV